MIGKRTKAPYLGFNEQGEKWVSEQGLKWEGLRLNSGRGDRFSMNRCLYLENADEDFRPKESRGTIAEQHTLAEQSSWWEEEYLQVLYAAPRGMQDLSSLTGDWTRAYYKWKRGIWTTGTLGVLFIRRMRMAVTSIKKKKLPWAKIISYWQGKAFLIKTNPDSSC